MQPIFGFENNHTAGCIGFSFLRKSYIGGKPERITMLMLRDSNGKFLSCISVPAESLRSTF